MLAISGTQEVQDYLIQEVQRVYRMQGVDINDKHIEIIVRQMLRKVRVDDAGDTDLLVSSLADKNEVLSANEAIRQRIANGEEGLKEATYTPILLGITKASLATDSFLSAASFQEIKKNRHVVVTNEETGDSRSYLIPFGSRLTVKEGEYI